MTALPIPVQAALAAVVLAAAFSDLKSREIPNWLSGGGILLGLALHTWLNGWAGLKFSGSGLGVAALIFLPLFMMRWLGGGDVKLMAAVGALAGMTNMLVIFILDTIFGGVIALLAILFRGRVKKTLVNIGRMLKSMARGRAPYQDSEELEAGHEKSMGLPRAVTIAAATLLVLWASRG